MKFGKYDITAKNVWAYIQGNTRKIIDEIGPDIFKSPQHIQEQIIWREVIHNPECFKQGKCIHCHCDVPDKFYSDKECEGGCYPAIMDKDTWNKFNQLCARRKIDIYNDKFDWDVVLADIESIDNIYFSTLIGVEQASKNLGTFKKGTELTHRFELFNPYEQPLIINKIHPSCPCLTATFNKIIAPNEYGYIDCIINTNDKAIKQHEIWVTVRYNEITRINLKLQFEII